LLTQVIFAVQSYWLFRMILEAMSRGEVIARNSEERGQLKQVALKDLCKGSYSTPDRLLSETSVVEDDPDITDRRRDCTELVRLTFGRKWAAVYLVMMSLYLVGALTPTPPSSLAPSCPTSPSGPSRPATSTKTGTSQESVGGSTGCT
jgi:hypothetical protein